MPLSHLFRYPSRDIHEFEQVLPILSTKWSAMLSFQGNRNTHDTIQLIHHSKTNRLNKWNGMKLMENYPHQDHLKVSQSWGISWRISWYWRIMNFTFDLLIFRFKFHIYVVWMSFWQWSQSLKYNPSVFCVTFWIYNSDFVE